MDRYFPESIKNASSKEQRIQNNFNQEEAFHFFGIYRIYFVNMHALSYNEKYNVAKNSSITYTLIY